jgi:hypothetical protein
VSGTADAVDFDGARLGAVGKDADAEGGAALLAEYERESTGDVRDGGSAINCASSGLTTNKVQMTIINKCHNIHPHIHIRIHI